MYIHVHIFIKILSVFLPLLHICSLEKQDGLCRKLLEPFPKLCIDGLTDDLQISSDSVKCSRKLGEGMFSIIHSGNEKSIIILDHI